MLQTAKVWGSLSNHDSCPFQGTPSTEQDVSGWQHEGRAIDVAPFWHKTMSKDMSEGVSNLISVDGSMLSHLIC